MIKGVSGVPGAGKTYYVVHEISEKYFTFSKQYSEWQLNDKFKDLVIFTNIKGFKLHAIQIDDYCTQHNITWETLLTVPYLEKYVQDNPDIKIIFLIDEAQKYFPTTYKNNDVFFFFQYHRHLGIDIYLTYQTWASINRKITDLCEFEIRAVRKSFKLGSEFRYQFYAGMDKIGGTIKRSNPLVFALYTSFDTTTEGTEKAPRPLRKMLVFSVIFTIIFVVLFKYMVSHLFTPDTGSVSASSSVPAVRQTQTNNETNTPPVNKQLPVQQQEISSSTFINTGGVWIGQRLISVNFFGRLIPLSEFPFQYYADLETRSVRIAVPDSVLASINQPHLILINPTVDKTPPPPATASETSDRERGGDGVSNSRFRQPS